MEHAKMHHLRPLSTIPREILLGLAH